jgi:hypothetical protein
MIMNDIELTDNGTALYDGKEYDIHSFDYAGQEAITIPDLDLISYDDGDSWQDMD